MYVCMYICTSSNQRSPHRPICMRVRQVLFLMTLGGSSVFLCGVRHANAFAKWMASRRVAEVAASRANFLCCLMPPRSLLPYDRSLLPYDRSLFCRITGLFCHVRRVFNSRMSAPVAADEPLVVEPLQDIFVMFCSLPDFASMGAKCTPEELFALLNKVFSVFDQHVSKLALFKYHHISNSYVVTSRRAALVPPPEDLRLHTELSDFLLLADRLQNVVQDFNAPGTDTPLQLCCGIHVFSKVPSAVSLHGNCTRALIFENTRQAYTLVISPGRWLARPSAFTASLAMP